MAALIRTDLRTSQRCAASLRSVNSAARVSAKCRSATVVSDHSCILYVGFRTVGRWEGLSCPTQHSNRNLSTHWVLWALKQGGRCGRELRLLVRLCVLGHGLLRHLLPFVRPEQRRHGEYCSALHDCSHCMISALITRCLLQMLSVLYPSPCALAALHVACCMLHGVCYMAQGARF